MGTASSVVPCATNASRGYEIEYDAKVEEWYLCVEDRPPGFEEKRRATSSTERLLCGTCCRNDEEALEEVVIIHHEALRKVDFLLRYDELARCESPHIPSCVTALKNEKLNRRFPPRGYQMSKNPGGNTPMPAGEDSDDLDSTCSGERMELDRHAVLPSDLMNHIVEERKKLQSFLQKMAVDGLNAETLENMGNPGKQPLLGRGKLAACVLRIEERQDLLYLIIELHGAAPRILPIHTIATVHYGSAHEAIEGEDPKLCLVIHQSVVKNLPRAGDKAAGSMDVLHHVKFPDTVERDFFTQGFKRLRDNHRFHVSGRTATP